MNYQTTKCSNLADPEQTRQITLAKTWVGEMSGTEKKNMTQKGMLSESNRASRQTPSAHAAPFLVWGDLRVARPPHGRNSSQSVPRKLSSTRPSTRPIVFGFVPCRPILEDQKKKNMAGAFPSPDTARHVFPHSPDNRLGQASISEATADVHLSALWPRVAGHFRAQEGAPVLYPIPLENHCYIVDYWELLRYIHIDNKEIVWLNLHTSPSSAVFVQIAQMKQRREDIETTR